MKKYLIFSLSIFALLILSACGSEEMASSGTEKSDTEKPDSSDKIIVVAKPDTKAIEAPQLPSASLSPTQDLQSLVN